MIRMFVSLKIPKIKPDYQCDGLEWEALGSDKVTLISKVIALIKRLREHPLLCLRTHQKALSENQKVGPQIDTRSTSTLILAFLITRTGFLLFISHLVYGFLL